MLSVEEALAQILSRVRPLGTEQVAVLSALGRVLAEPIVARRELPPWPNSSMDGYAVRAEDTRPGGAALAVVGRVIAGDMPARILRAGEAMRIFTGAPLPEGADAVVPPRPEAIIGRLGWPGSAGALVPSAGVSVGELDLVRAALQRSGAQLHLWKVSMRPGKPITFGSLDGRPVFGLPGNPVSAMVTFELFVRPALRRMLGCAVVARPRVVARALAPIANRGARRGYLRVGLSRDAEGYGARLTGDQGSGILRSMVLADGLAVVAPDTEISAGGPVEVIVLRGLEPRATDTTGR